MNKKILKSVSFLIFLFLIGIVFYTQVEGKDLINAFYISGSVLTTLGLGEFEPSNIGKIFTILYSIVGLGTIFYISYNFANFLSTKEIHVPEFNKKKKRKH